MSRAAGVWRLCGEALVAFTARRPRRPPLPPGLATLPGPAMIVASRYTDSPVGPFLELSVAEPVRFGVRVGWCRTLVVVDRNDVRIGDRLQWGFPAEVGTLRWFVRGEQRELVWDEHDVVVRGEPHGPMVPWWAPQRTLQERNREPVVVPGHIRGLARGARVAVQTMPGDSLAGLAGHHVGVVVTGMHRVWHDARSPVVRRAAAGARPVAVPRPPEPVVFAAADAARRSPPLTGAGRDLR